MSARGTRHAKVQEEDLALVRAGTRPSTQTGYEREYKEYVEWKEENGWGHPGNSEDIVFNKYILCLWRKGGEGRKYRAKAKTAHAAVVQRDPQLSRRMPLSLKSLQGWNRAAPPDSHPPMPRPMMLLLVNWLFSKSRVGEALCIWTIFGAANRAREVTDLKLGGVVPAGQDQLQPDSKTMGLILYKTKTTPKALHLRSELLSQTLTVWYDHRRAQAQGPWKDRSFFGVSYDQAATALQEAAAALGVSHLGFVLHSLRHGAAAHARWVERQSVEEIAELGRWKSLDGLRTYLQTARLILMGSAIPERLTTLYKQARQLPLSFLALTQEHVVRVGLGE
jgi:hypothetical protein